MKASQRKREAVEVAAQPLRELLRAEHDEIAAAQRALRQAEKAHDRAIELARRKRKAAKTSEPLSAYGHQVILFADRLSTEEANHELTSDVSARVEGRRLVVEGPDWRREVEFPRHDERKVRALADDIEAAARYSDMLRLADDVFAEQAEEDLGIAWADRRAVQETSGLIHKLGDLVQEGEDVLDMSPGISAGHDGVLVATDRRLLFVSVRRTLSLFYAQISAVAVKGRWFGARLAVSTPEGKGVFSGITPGHAAAIADLVRSRIPGQSTMG